VTVTRGRDGISYPAAGCVGPATGGGGQQLLVVGVDGTTAGAAALRWAVDQGRRAGGRVLAIAVSEPPPLVAGGPEIAGAVIAQQKMLDEEIAAVADQWLTDAITALPAGAGNAVERRVARGDAVTVLLEAARDADLLVLGNHGRGALAGALAGSVALRCAHHVECPLVLVPAPEEAAEADAR
jgi:nucleotide-binding universal stress UspA family protein